jgi:hypothetical protein
MLKIQFPIVSVVLFSIVTVALPATLQEVQYALAQTGIWSLEVSVNNIPTDANTVIVTVKDSFNGFISKEVDASSSDNSIFTIFYIQDNKIPDGYNYNVCVRESGAAFDWCRTINHNGGIIGRVMIDWPDSSQIQPPPSGPSGGGFSGVCPDTAHMSNFNMIPIQLCAPPVPNTPEPNIG